jgi:hypothetical protein
MVEPAFVFTVNQTNLSQPAGPETVHIRIGHFQHGRTDAEQVLTNNFDYVSGQFQISHSEKYGNVTPTTS